MTNLLAKKAVLSALNISHWSARRFDRKVTNEINTAHESVADAGRYNKLLIRKEALLPIAKIVSEARTYHSYVTQPWLDTGMRLLPAKLFEEHSMRMRQLRIDFERAADEFAEAYPKHVEARQKELGSLFDETDYPEWKRVRSMFDFDINTMPCPDSKDFRVELADGHVKDIQREVEQRMQRALDDAMREPVRRIVETVGHMAARLSTYKPPVRGKIERDGKMVTGVVEEAQNDFRDSLVSNVRDLVQILPAFNLTDDATLAKITERMERDLCATEAKDLRESDVVRTAVAQSANEILDLAKQFLA